MDTAVIVALITGGLAALSNVLVAMMNSKLMIYRIEQLEKSRTSTTQCRREWH